VKPQEAATVYGPMQGRELVAAVREAARRHSLAWEALVPDSDRVDVAHEAAEERAFDDLVAARRALRDHICETYGITAREFASLAKP